MNISDLNPTNPKFEPGRPVYVLLHSDHSHIYPSPDGGPAWSYSEDHLKLIQQIIRKDFAITAYHICLLSTAWPLLCNCQGELEQIWKATIARIRKMRSLQDRIYTYRQCSLRCNRPHPISLDAELKKLLGVE
jgi:hypothetical protein